MDKVKRVRMLGACVVAAFALGGVIAQTAAAEFEPNWPEFENCPAATNPQVTVCTQGHTNEGAGGSYTVGPITVPVLKSIVLQGGYDEPECSPGRVCNTFFAPENGAPIIVPTPEVVPGEVLANISKAEQEELGWPKKLRTSYRKAQKKLLFKEGQTTEVIESEGVPGLSVLNLVFEEGVAIEAPIKITGKNPWLEKMGGDCEIGSTSEPIVQDLHSGLSTSPLTGETIRGSAGKLEIRLEGSWVQLTGTELVDNTYAVPGAHGCGGPKNEAFLDPVVDKAFGIPAPAGASVTRLIGEFTNLEAVYWTAHHP